MPLVTGSSRRAVPRLKTWLAMSPDTRKQAVSNMLWGYDDSELNLTELVEIVGGGHGAVVAEQFIETLSCGMTRPGGGTVMSFAHLCVRFGRMDALAEIVTQPAQIVAGATMLTTSAWINRLCTRTTETGQVITWSLFKMGLNCTPAGARKVFEFALQHQPDHPDIETAMTAAGPAAAILAELVMARHIGSSRADCGHPESLQSGDSSDRADSQPASESDSARRVVGHEAPLPVGTTAAPSRRRQAI